jgi:hypothetical protein
MLGRTGADAEPDSVWMFGTDLRIGIEAKSECDPDGEVKADTVRELGGHLNYAAVSTDNTPSPGSFAVIISPLHRRAPRRGIGRRRPAIPGVASGDRRAG